MINVHLVCQFCPEICVIFRLLYLIQVASLSIQDKTGKRRVFHADRMRHERPPGRVNKVIYFQPKNKTLSLFTKPRHEASHVAMAKD